MKHFFDPYLYALGFLGCSSLLFSFILAILYNFNWIDTQLLTIILFCFSTLSFFISGWIFAKKARKKALIQALLISTLFFGGGFLLLSVPTPMSLIFLFIKTFAFSFSAVIVLNRFGSSFLK